MIPLRGDPKRSKSWGRRRGWVLPGLQAGKQALLWVQCLLGKMEKFRRGARREHCTARSVC